MSVSLPSQKTTGTKEDTAGSCCSIRVEQRFCEEARKEKPRSKDLEEEVNRR